MSGFIDTYPPDMIYRFNWRASPRFSTDITVSASGAERRNSNWNFPLRRFVAPGIVDCDVKMNQIYEMWLALMGPAYSFPIRDPMDFASRPIVSAFQPPALSAADQFIAATDGVQDEFQLRKSYTFGSRTLVRPIYHPVVSSVLLALDGNPLATATGGPYTADIDRETGIVRLDPVPPAGLVLTAGYLFDCEVRFEADDTYERMVRAFGATSVADLVLIEIPPCGG